MTVRRTLAIRNLTGPGAHFILKRGGVEGKYRVSDRGTADNGTAAAKAVAPARSVRQAAAAHHSARHDRGNADLRARDHEFPDEPAERSPRGGEYRGAGAGC